MKNSFELHLISGALRLCSRVLVPNVNRTSCQISSSADESTHPLVLALFGNQPQSFHSRDAEAGNLLLPVGCKQNPSKHLFSLLFDVFPPHLLILPTPQQHLQAKIVTNNPWLWVVTKFSFLDGGSLYLRAGIRECYSRRHLKAHPVFWSFPFMNEYSLQVAQSLGESLPSVLLEAGGS